MVGPDPAVARVRAGVRDLLERLLADGTLAPGALLLVACSGGADSIALASQTAFLAPRLGLHAGAAVVDHGVRPDSAAVAARAAATCAALALDPVLVRRVPDLPRASETAAREARYVELDAAREQVGATGVLLGHTLDDQAETVLLAAGRGSGTRSLAGMSEVRGTYWRPLLGVRRSDTHQTCAALDLSCDVDPSNAVDGPWRRSDGGPVPRAAVRDVVLTALGDALGRDPAPALARTARLAQADADLLDELATAAWTRCLVDREDGADGAAVLLDVDALAAEPAAFRTRVLRRAALVAGAPGVALLESHVRALESLVIDWRGQGEVALPGRVGGRRDCGRLVVARPAGRTDRLPS
ncbi:tRNA lysidine(34) synthetase TilS [Pseudactinotalea suaedae]|uniref:tRNA lysidine(34) synthetase TilS n=1 Tax=Pseudactinotalea suaedae TaxID=1524924 RepID=UPI0012E303FD|nr:tRNA lysidine(34) synthetase TilS [Pseudactinotalea suaedae]